jgi:hypothetical protein
MEVKHCGRYSHRAGKPHFVARLRRLIIEACAERPIRCLMGAAITARLRQCDAAHIRTDRTDVRLISVLDGGNSDAESQGNAHATSFFPGL